MVFSATVKGNKRSTTLLLAALSARRTVIWLWSKWQVIGAGLDEPHRNAVRGLRQSRRNHRNRVANGAGAAGDATIVACLHRRHIVEWSNPAAEERHGGRGGALYGTEQDE
jgi:hypothetical protein